jgi:hypothetical protein
MYGFLKQNLLKTYKLNRNFIAIQYHFIVTQ